MSSYPDIETLRKAAIAFAQTMQEANRYDMYDKIMEFLFSYCVGAEDDANIDLEAAVDEFVRLRQEYSKSRDEIRETPLYGSEVDKAFMKE